MKNTTLLFLTILVFFSCKQDTKTTDYKNETLDVTTSIYPENISKIFDAHGTLDVWNTMQSLVFTMPKPDGDEITTTNLKSRESLIEMPSHTIGFDGNELWLSQKDTTTYKGNPRFYYNLMFYFYSMPFILADDGISYKDTEPLNFKGKDYPGILISYDAGVGESPDDEYILYYNPETYKMEWLAYTVTYFSKEKGKEFHFIKYSDWQTVEGLKLPKTLTWYNYENNQPTTKRNDVNFVNVSILKTKPDDSMFKKPEDAKTIE
ncbi:MAG: hypothetical protein DRI75_05825 [Bacteroidetes bacterium]|nr:MAG: hypothetical protein DRI75_05825 [Bacteroidota bacterium]